MSVAVLLSHGSEGSWVLPVAARLAEARGCGLLILETEPGLAEAASPPLGESSAASVDPRAPLTASLQLLVEREVEVLVLPRRDRQRAQADGAGLARQLFLRAPCDTLLVRAATVRERFARIVVPVAGGPHSSLALRMAVQLAASADGRVTAVFVEPRIGSEAEAVGHRILTRLVRRAVPDQADLVDLRVVVADDVYAGIASTVDEEVDLVLAGSSYLGAARRLLFGALSDRLLSREGPAVMVVRRAIPLASRLRQAVDRWLQAGVPQLDRDGRLGLVERVQSNSAFDFDFIALLSLSTLIAGLGLLQNAAAVIIGAMLVAPLMTPLVGTGLALVQGNLRLIRSALRSVALGFVCAFALGAILGWVVSGSDVTDEMFARGSPGVLDLVIALLSGMAAAYASSRPHLSAALPGVAIAAALVPPVATAGLALSLGRTGVAAGAALLFGTNMVAIVLGSAACLWAVGFRASHQHGRLQRWVPTGLVLSLVLFGLTIWALDPGVELSEDLRGELRGLVQESAATVVGLELDDSDGRTVIRVVVESSGPLPPALAGRLRETASASLGRHVVLRLETRLVTEVSR